MPRIKFFTLRNERTRWLTTDEEHKLLEAAKATKHLYNLIVFLLDTGTRLSEAIELEWQHVNLWDGR